MYMLKYEKDFLAHFDLNLGAPRIEFSGVGLLIRGCTKNRIFRRWAPDQMIGSSTMPSPISSFFRDAVCPSSHNRLARRRRHGPNSCLPHHATFRPRLPHPIFFYFSFHPSATISSFLPSASYRRARVMLLACYFGGK